MEMREWIPIATQCTLEKNVRVSISFSIPSLPATVTSLLTTSELRQADGSGSWRNGGECKGQAEWEEGLQRERKRERERETERASTQRRNEENMTTKIHESHSMTRATHHAK